MSKTEQQESGPIWRKSSYSVGNGACAEVAETGGIVLVRDSAGSATRRLRFPAKVWREFIARTRTGRP